VSIEWFIEPHSRLNLNVLSVAPTGQPSIMFPEKSIINCSRKHVEILNDHHDLKNSVNFTVCKLICNFHTTSLTMQRFMECADHLWFKTFFSRNETRFRFSVSE
jgi:hypothetical protein